MGFPVLGGEGEEAYAIRPYLAGRKKDHPLGFPALGGEDEGRMFLHPNPAGRRKERPFSFPVPKKDGIQKCTP